MSWARRRVEVAQRPQVALRTRPRRNRHLTSFYLHYLYLRIYGGVGGPRGSTDVARGQEDNALGFKPHPHPPRPDVRRWSSGSLVRRNRLRNETITVKGVIVLASMSTV